MIEDKIQLALKDIARIKGGIKDIKKDKKKAEKIDNDQYDQLRKAYKDLRAQLKGMEEDNEEELKKDDFYNQLRELEVQKEEELAHASASLFDAVSKLPAKPWMMRMDTEEGPVNIQINPDMRVYVNGREEKKRI